MTFGVIDLREEMNNDVWEGMRFGWMDGHPPLIAVERGGDGRSEVVEVLAMRRVRAARWDGQNWIDEMSHQVLVGVMRWRTVRV